jgi:Ca2+-binding RTX toxin-like protein
VITGSGGADRIVLTSDMNAAASSGTTVVAAEDFERVRIEGQGGADIIDASGYADHGVTIRGNGGADQITGTALGDDIDGGGAGDVIDAGAGDDLVRGGAGNDSIRGGAGDDDLFGDAGNDTFHHTAGDGNDRIDGGMETGVSNPDYDVLVVTGDAEDRTYTIGKLPQSDLGNIAPPSEDLDDVTVQYTGSIGTTTIRADEIERVVLNVSADDTIAVGALGGTAIKPTTPSTCATSTAAPP